MGGMPPGMGGMGGMPPGMGDMADMMAAMEMMMGGGCMFDDDDEPHHRFWAPEPRQQSIEPKFANRKSSRLNPNCFGIALQVRKDYRKGVQTEEEGGCQACQACGCWRVKKCKEEDDIGRGSSESTREVRASSQGFCGEMIDPGAALARGCRLVASAVLFALHRHLCLSASTLRSTSPLLGTRPPLISRIMECDVFPACNPAATSLIQQRLWPESTRK